jgi:signal transduction histidine kinase
MLALNFQPVWLHHLIDAVESQVSQLVEQRKLKLVIERDAIPLTHTFGDPERLLQVLEKVVMNAIKYTPDGGQIVISGRELPGFVDLTIQDEGIGIAPRDLQRIFDAFSSTGDVSLHSSGKTKFKGGGPGLGLPIAKGIIEAHGGTIWAQSAGYSETDHPGSTFHLMIPMRDAPPPEQVEGAIGLEHPNEE